MNDDETLKALEKKVIELENRLADLSWRFNEWTDTTF